MKVVNTVAYYDMAPITAVKRVIVQDPGVVYTNILEILFLTLERGLWVNIHKTYLQKFTKPVRYIFCNNL